MPDTKIASTQRKADHPIDRMFLDRWSPRAFTAESVPEEDLLTMLEAGRWAASCYNAQPWRFVYARRDTEHWPRLLGLLAPGNHVWAQHAAALVLFLSKTTMRPPGSEEDKPAPTHAFDTGTASGYFALEANRLGWHVHGMFGFDRERAVSELKVPSGFEAHAVFAVGRLGDASRLPEALQAREHPSPRKPLSEVAFEGIFAAR